MSRGPAPVVPRLVLTSRTRLLGAALLGGDPPRLLRLSPPGLALLLDLLAGQGRTDAARTLALRLCGTGLAAPRWPASTPVPAVTVVIPVRDRAGELDRCLAALGSAPAIVVVDDGSRDAAAVATVAARYDAALVRHPVARGPAAARNAGLATVHTPAVAFLDSDTVPPRGWPGSLLRHLADPAVDAVASRVVPLPDPARHRPGRVRDAIRGARSPLDLGPHEGDVRPLSRLPYVPTAALVVRAEALRAGFDERLRHGEDVDLAWRLTHAGRAVRYDPSSRVGHVEPHTWRAVLGRRFRYGTSAAPLHRRHPGLLTPVVLSPLPTAAAAACVAAVPAISLPLAAALTAVLAARIAVRLHRARLPAGTSVRVAVPIAIGATSGTLQGLGRATRSLLPLLPLLPLGARAVAPRLGRRLALPLSRRLALLAAGPALAEWLRLRPRIDPLRWVLATAVEDAAYGAGVWRSCWQERTLGPLLPRAGRATRSGTLGR